MNSWESFTPEVRALLSSDPLYPTGALDAVDDHALNCCYTLGDREALTQPLLALLCSERCPGDLIIKACDAATMLRNGGVPTIGGFHSPVERECLQILLRGNQPIVISPARSLERMRLPTEWRDPIRGGRLLLISPFKAKQSRITAALAAQRNEFVATLARAILIVYADPGGLVESLAKKILGWQKPLFALQGPANANLFAMGAQPIEVKNAERLALMLEQFRKSEREAKS